jgi:hypothetical protein
MALICAQCGTDNPAGNAFCMSCGSPLAAVAAGIPAATPPAAGVPFADPDATQPFVLPVPAAPPPIGDPAVASQTPPASFLPPGYLPGASPYLPAPPAGTPPAHRTSSTMVIAIVAAVLIVICGGGVVYAAVHKGGTTATVSPNAPANVPTTPATSAPTAAPTQPPASTPSGPTGTTAGGQTVTTQFAKVFVPSGYTVTDQEDDYIVLTPSSGDEEVVGLQSEPLDGPTTNAQLDQALLAGDQQSGDPSAKMCTTKAPGMTQLMGSGGPISADVIDVCESLTPDNGPAFSAVDAYIAGVAKAANGSLKAVWVEILAPASSFQAFANSIPGSLLSQSVFTDASPIS